MIRQFFGTMIVASCEKEWLKRPIKYKYWKLFRAALSLRTKTLPWQK